MHNWDITVFGLVQGVGFRPFVAEAARELSISGTVWNAGGIVKIRAAACDVEALELFARRLSSCPPAGARIDLIEITSEEKLSTSAIGDDGLFRIVESEAIDDELRVLPADLATCGTCERELLDRTNRRYRYPFISCVACGPRFSIMSEVPYDRERTTMGVFGMCNICREEYERPGDIRRYAQTIACATCGPEVRLHVLQPLEETVSAGQGITGETMTHSGRILTGDEAIRETVKGLRAGRIVAVKDIGGYHFCFDPDCEEAAVRLRRFKNRERKPLAVMFPDCEAVRKYCRLSNAEEELLVSPARPIVLLDKKKGMDFAPSVCGQSRQIGAMLPSNPIQILLSQACGPLVMTSGNRGGEPIITSDEVMLALWRESMAGTDAGEGFPDAVLAHDREILNGLDDSVYQVLSLPCDNPGSEQTQQVQILRRARGLVPEPIRLPGELEADTFAAGGDLKAVFALGRSNHAYLSGHFGDLDDRRAVSAREDGIIRMETLLGIHPSRIVCDRHPGYISVRDAIKRSSDVFEPGRGKTGAENLRVSPMEKGVRAIQHHHAHILSVTAEHGLTGKVLGVAFDGTGYGDDGSIWGSEFLLCEGREYRRVGHFSAIPMTGGDAPARDARLSLYAFLNEAKRRELVSEAEITELFREKEDSFGVVSSALNAGVNTIVSSSMGRLFDAVSALLNVSERNTYEGECAQLLQASAESWAEEKSVSITEYIPEIWAPVKEMCVKPAGTGEACSGDSADRCEADSVYLIAQLVRHVLYGEDVGELMFAFHMAVADAASELCARIGCEQVVLSGGTMCNRLLLRRLIPSLRKQGMKVYMNSTVPPGDGGLALGQLMAMLPVPETQSRNSYDQKQSNNSQK